MQLRDFVAELQKEKDELHMEFAGRPQEDALPRRMDLWCQFGAKPALPLKGVGEISPPCWKGSGRFWPGLRPTSGSCGLDRLWPILARVCVFMLLTDFGQTDFGQF